MARRRSLEQKIMPLATRFATQVARIVQQDTRQAVAQEVRERLRAARGGSAGARTATKKIVVDCPVAGCKNPGVRTLMNFCVEHNRTLGVNEKKRLREAQRQARAKAAAKA